MKIIPGPRYRYQGERLQQPEIILVEDHHYDPHTGYALRSLLAASLCPIDQHLLVFDHVIRQDEFADCNHVCLPLLLAAECHEFNQECIETYWGTRTHAFNFMINKPRPHRVILLDTVHDMQFKSYKHSLCWSQSYKSIPATKYMFGDERTLDQGIMNGQHSNASTYHQLLKTAVFEGTCVSLITEPVFWERETIVTEKTLMAIWAGTLPIWIGGWKCPDAMRDFGFDTFDDVIDHSYQDLSDPHDRCCRALLDNRHLLDQPRDMAPYQDRLKHNLDLLTSNVFLQDVKSKISTRPELAGLVERFRNGLLAQR